MKEKASHLQRVFNIDNEQALNFSVPISKSDHVDDLPQGDQVKCTSMFDCNWDKVFEEIDKPHGYENYSYPGRITYWPPKF